MQILIKECELMSSVAWWHHSHFKDKKYYLIERARIVRSIRHFFDRHAYIEVDTPTLQHSPGMEEHVHAFKTELVNVHQDETRTMYLHTSPEFAMKKLLVAGMGKIYQMCKCFRNAEGSTIHSPEFTMLEWYHTGVDYHQLMEEVRGLLQSVTKTFEWKGVISDPHKKWQKITVCEAFQMYAELDLESVLEDRDAFAQAAEKIGIAPHDEDTWEDLFFRIFLEKIEHHLGVDVPTFLYDYPISMAALARPKAKDPRFAERFEVYICGIELANGFGELTDAVEQKKRFEEAMGKKAKRYGQTWPVDDDFIAALEEGMPPTSGIALGVDRLVMLATGSGRIEKVMSYIP